MKRSFWRFYLLLLLAMIAIAWAVEGLLRSLQNDEAAWVPAQHFFCETKDRSACKQITAQWTQLGINDVQIDAAQQQRLVTGAILTVRDEQQQAWLLKQQGQHYWYYGPMPGNDDDTATTLYLYLLFFGVFGGLLLIWLWPLFRDLERVRQQLNDPQRARGVIHFDLSRRSVVAPLAHTITHLSQQAEHLLQTQRELSHFIAHDLRTPLARMRFALAVDISDVAQMQRDLIDNITELERTATEYLRYAEQEAQHSVLHLTTIDTKSFFSALQHHYQHSQKKLQWHYPQQGEFYGDEFGLQRALCNLIDNAEQYAADTIVIRFKQAHHCCVITVDDDGPGIPQRARQQFGRQTPFDPQRVRGQREQGFGLGLYIVRRVAMLHRGHLRIGASPQHGARFLLLWPDRA